MNRSKLVMGGLILATMVVVPGLSKYALTELGFPWIGTFVWYGGYGLGVLLVWALWIRPLDISGPSDLDHPGE